MPVQLTEATLQLTTDDIRAFMRDQPEYNILLDDIEFADTDINRAMRFTVSKWNAMPPVTNIPGPEYMNEWVLLCGVCCILLKSEGLRQKRNQMITRDGNIEPVGLDEKEALYLKWSQVFCQEFEILASGIKKQENMESLLDVGPCASNGLGSGYRYIGRWSRY